jgi:hypothetical protein
MDKEKISQKDIAGFFNSMISAMGKEARQRYAPIIDDLYSSTATPEDYYLQFLFPLSQALEQTIKLKLPKVDEKNINNIWFLYHHHNFIDHSFERIIKDIDGFTCCADKSGNMTRQLLNYYITGEKFDLSRDGKEYTFNIPSFWDDNCGDEWIEFFESLKSFYYGRPNRYLEFVKNTWLKLLKERKQLQASGKGGVK